MIKIKTARPIGVRMADIGAGGREYNVKEINMIKFSIGDRVAFARDVVRRVGHDKHTADARGRVVAIDGRVVAVDFGQTMVRDDGETVRYVPAANLTKILANGVIYD
jgi:hypothetical protein